MMVQGRHPENAFALGQLEIADLKNNRKSFDDEYTADDHQ